MAGVVGVIPARLGATRFPNKPLVDIFGEPMLLAVYRRAAAVLDRVILAVDGPELADLGRSVGAEVVLTDPALPSGSDRVAAALDQLGDWPEHVINVQGDLPLLPAAHLKALVARAGEAPVITLRCPLVGDPHDPARVKVVTDDLGRALYFSRSPVPSGGPWHEHIGLYLYTASALRGFVAAPPSALERSERLEQLRLMSLGVPILVADVATGSPSIDLPADLDRLRRAGPPPRGSG